MMVMNADTKDVHQYSEEYVCHDHPECSIQGFDSFSQFAGGKGRLLNGCHDNVHINYSFRFDE